jgi:hypothetical protein
MKKSLFIFTTLFFGLTLLHAQNPYEALGIEEQVLHYDDTHREVFDIDTLRPIGYGLYSPEFGLLAIYDLEDSLIRYQKIDPSKVARWLSGDPKATEFPEWSPYAGFGDNPIRNIDPDGMKFINFDAQGNYLSTSNDNWWHNMWHGSKGQVLDNNGIATQKFKFADPKNDVAAIQSGEISRLVFVSESDVKLMVARSGGFDHENKTANRTWGERYSYIQQEGVGGGRMDFSFTQIPRVYVDASTDPLNQPSPLIFLSNGVAHNQMNFGNFLFATSGQAQGFSLVELKAGAHFNSVMNSPTNGYGPQLDSSDDQFSIEEGFKFGKQNGYEKKEFRVEVGPLLPGGN